MAGDRTSTSVLDETEPPFLQEPTERIEVEPDQPFIDRLVEVTYRWRVALTVGLAPLLLAAVALAYDGEPAADPDLRDGQTSNLESMVREVAGQAADELESEATTPDEGEDEAPPTLPAPAPTTTAAPTTSSTTTTTAPTTTSTTTTTTTTSPPQTVVECLITVRRRVDLHAEPSEDSEELARVQRGTYGGFERTDDESWYLIDYQGRMGWIRSRAIGSIEGDCGPR